MKTLPYTAIILAAGLSSRMERFKPLLRIGGRTATDRVISLYRKLGIETILVIGWQKEKLLSGIKSRNVKVVENPDFEQGMFSSVKAGFSRAGASAHGSIFIHPVDIPLVRLYTVKRLIDAAERNPNLIIHPVCSGRRGHPVLLPSGIIPSVLAWEGEGGLKAVIENHEGPEVDVPVPDECIHLDMDTHADYRLLLERYQSYQIPSDVECDIINDINMVAQDRRRHCSRVADIAMKLGSALAEKGSKVDLALVKAAAVLHDMAKGQKDHAVLGGRLLAEMGFSRTGAVVAAHTDLPDGIPDSSIEAKIVFLADKFVAGEKTVSLDERFARPLERFGKDSTVKADILRRKEASLALQREFEAILGQPLEKTILDGTG
ncbi:MAG: NTP transferase domain-containing protein [Dehalococcoidales bacterium]|nr:NTP transferase domain-containing protein [Dehalococcoidales bacterium]